MRRDEIAVQVYRGEIRPATEKVIFDPNSIPTSDELELQHLIRDEKPRLKRRFIVFSFLFIGWYLVLKRVLGLLPFEFVLFDIVFNTFLIWALHILLVELPNTNGKQRLLETKLSYKTLPARNDT